MTKQQLWVLISAALLFSPLAPVRYDLGTFPTAASLHSADTKH